MIIMGSLSTGQVWFLESALKQGYDCPGQAKFEPWLSYRQAKLILQPKLS